MSRKPPADLTPESWQRIWKAIDWNEGNTQEAPLQRQLDELVENLPVEEFFPQPKKRVKHPAGVYFVGSEDGPVKIGYSNNPSQRLNTLQIGHHAPLRIHAVLPAERWAESALHARFASARVSGEWYKRTPEIEVFIARISVGLFN